jgi:hypothetical protein
LAWGGGALAGFGGGAAAAERKERPLTSVTAEMQSLPTRCIAWSSFEHAVNGDRDFIGGVDTAGDPRFR